MAQKAKKTNAMRILDSLGIPYRIHPYDDDGEHTLERGAAISLAQKLGIESARVFKTILMRNEKRECFVFCQSAGCEINLKKARTICGAKEISPVKPEELLSLTGYVRGGCSPLGMKRNFPTYIDESILKHQSIFVSAGQRGLQMELSPSDLIKATNATVADLAL